MTTKFANEVSPINIEQELKKSYLDYAMSVIVGRALPDVRDGLKPVHRRVLFAMKELGNDYNKPYKKSARIVGDVIGKYHPHGDTAVYDTIVRMAQPFSLRYMLIDGQGNFGSVDGDSPAAMRYTEIRMSKIAHSLLIDIDKNTINFSNNYDETEHVPDVLPTRIPNLLVNGSSGIAVGMATNIPPHNLAEVIDATVALIKDPSLNVEKLMHYIPGPDFPTAAFINGNEGIIDAYNHGRGRVIMRSRTRIETNKNDREQIIITEIPYQVNKAKLVEKIADLVKEKKIEGISELRDESDKDGMRIVIDVKRGEVSEVILNNLYAQTQMQMSFGVNMVALVDGQPKTLNLKEVLESFIKHRKEVVTRRTIYDLNKARVRAHILEGLAVALSNIDEIISVIKSSKTPAQAKENLIKIKWKGSLVAKMLSKIDRKYYKPEGISSAYGLIESGKYQLTSEQVDSILELRLHRLTNLEQSKVIDGFEELLLKIKELISILENLELLLKLICEELEEVKEQFGDKRRSEILEHQVDLDHEDLIPQEDMVVTLSYDGYAKTQPLKEYNAQRRGGRGKLSTQIKSEDFVHKLQIASTHDTMLCFSSFGKVYWSKVYEFPQAGRVSKGKPINNLLPLQKGEKVTAMLAVSNYEEGKSVFMSTKKAIVKKVDLTAFSRPRKGGIAALKLDTSDELLHVALTDGKKEIMMFSDAGKVIRFNESGVRSMGRVARGVRGMKIQKDQRIVGVIVTDADHGVVLTATENGYGKRTPVNHYRRTSRGSQGVISIATSRRNGLVVSAKLVKDSDDIMLMTDQGVLIRTRVKEVRSTGRSAQGVRLINLKNKEQLVSVQVVSEDERDNF